LPTTTFTLSLHDALPICRDADRKARAAAEFTVHVNIAAHHAAEMPAQRESQTRAAILTRGRSVRLIEILEQLLEIVLGDADAGIDRKSTRLNSSHVAISY